jgi:hypothetical protein
LPATCIGGSPGTLTDQVVLVTGGVGVTYVCSATNTWTLVGGGGGLPNPANFPGPISATSITDTGLSGGPFCVFQLNGLIGTTGSNCGTSTGLPATVVYVPAGSNSATIQTALTNAIAGEEIWFSGGNTGCSLTLTVANVRLRGFGSSGTQIACATAGVPVLTISGQAPRVSGIGFTHITNSPTCPGGNGTSTCGDGLQIAAGVTRAQIDDVHTNFNYNGIALGATTYGEYSNSVSEFNNNHGVVFVMSASIKNMQWQVSRILSEQNLGNGFDMTCPASFTSVQTPGPYITGWTATFGNAGYGYKFSCSAATTSGIADIFMGNTFASQNNKSGYYFDVGPNGGRNTILTGFYSEQAGTYGGPAGFFSATQSFSAIGYGVEITNSCDPTAPFTISSGILWSNSYSGALVSCAATSLTGVDTDFNGRSAASAQTEAGITINATNVAINGGFHKTESYGVYVLSGDTPSITGTICDIGIPVNSCILSGTQPTNGYQQLIGQVRYISGAGVPAMNCQVGWNYDNITAASPSTVHYVCDPANTWTAVPGVAPVTVTTGASATLGGTYPSGYIYNQEATAGTAVTYTLPVAAAGKQYCVKNSNNGSAADTGVLTLQTSAAGQSIIFNGTVGASGGYFVSAGAAGDSACVVGISATQWEAYVQVGTWNVH